MEKFKVDDLIVWKATPGDGRIYKVTEVALGAERWFRAEVIFQLVGVKPTGSTPRYDMAAFEACPSSHLREAALELLKLTPAWRPSPIPPSSEKVTK